MSFFTGRRQADSETEAGAITRDKPAPPPQPIGFQTILGAGSVMDGKLVSEGNVRLDGDFTGTLDIRGNVLVGETAKINADIDARNISIAGAVRGNVSGNKVQLLRTGRIWGDIQANALTTEEGAFIDGKITMKKHEAIAEPEAPLADVPLATEPEDNGTPVAPVAEDDEDETITALDDETPASAEDDKDSEDD